ncbi:MAG: zf-TFIIB domain-containing protein [Candidatus Lindowbacteria bacterium]|nr:zf-TFIIB domain-containing protein [Candidatus Lindowbacteria bacterium]
MQCPKCNDNSLKEVRVKSSGIRVDSCSRCKGVWFDVGELEALLSAAAKNLRVPATALKSTVLSCPRCSTALYRFPYPQTNVKIEMCKECGGLWLDANEFNEIKAARLALEKRGKPEEYAHPTGAKGVLLRFIDTAIEALSFW